MTNEAGLQYEDLEKARDFILDEENNDVRFLKVEEKVWATKDIPNHLSYIVARSVIAPNYTCILQNKNSEIEGKGYGMSESEAIKIALKQYLQKWMI